jgi:hypothetical protein
VTEIGDAIWVISDRTPDDTYLVVVQVGPDTVITLPSAKGAEAYARAVIAACAYAEYDAAIFAQMHRVTKGDDQLAMSVVMDLREKRPPLDNVATAPLSFVPIVAHRTKKPAIHVELDRVPFSQWSPEEARGHAMHVLDAAAVVSLDAAFLNYQTTELGLDLERARAVVDQLREHREADREHA